MSSMRRLPRLFAFVVVFAAGWVLHRPDPPARPWPRHPPTEIIVNRPSGDGREVLHLRVTGVDDSHCRDTPAPSGPGVWRIVLSTPGQTVFCEAVAVAVD